MWNAECGRFSTDREERSLRMRQGYDDFLSIEKNRI